MKKLHRLSILSAHAGLVLALVGCPGDDGDEDTGNETGTTGDTDGTETGFATVNPTTTMSTTDETSTGTETGTDTTTAADSTESTGIAPESSTDESSTGNAGALPDIDMTAVAADIEQSAFTETLNFAPDDCALAEACINGSGERRILRFDTITPNLGDADFVVGNPNDNPENFEFGQCHGHYHFMSFANYRLLDMEGNVAATGHKQSFALIDLMKFLPEAGPGKYPLVDDTQGITVGWADVYNAGLDCQWIDITGVAPGNYQLEIHINFEEAVTESNFDNNVILVAVTIDESDPPPPEIPPEWTCSDDWYSGNDGCDCGCGAFDPDCANPTVDACDYCGEMGTCNPGDQDCSELEPNNNAVCQP